MAEVTKPDYTYLWSSGGAIVAPSNVKIQTGWTAEVPPFQWENWSQNRQDQAIVHILQKGISEWDALSDYYFTASGVRSYVQGSDGVVYVAVQDSTGQNPTTDATDTYWKVAWIDQTALNSSIASAGPVVSSARNAIMNVTAASATATFNADEVIVKSTLGGNTKTLNTFSKVINLATTGAGGMDTGAAPVSGYVALYAIYNPTTATSALLGVNASAAAAPEVYGGVNMPAAYTYSALLTVVPTNGSSQFLPVYVFNRDVWIINLTTLSTGTPQASPTVHSISAAVPRNAKTVDATTSISSSISGVTLSSSLSGSVGGIGRKTNATTSAATGAGLDSVFTNVPVVTQQTIYYTATVGGGSMTFAIAINKYSI